ncbi:MAG TPA: MCE family protein [Acidimicrobiales bacterium]|nr:MCE family protein [Acidimicrobiales bacterium]
MRRLSALGRTAVVLVALAVVVAAVVVIEKGVNGAYSGNHQVVGRFASAGQGIQPGAEVDFAGVQVGRVASIALVHRQAQLTLSLYPSFHFPADGTATIQPQNLFGADVVSITSPTGQQGPTLKPGTPIPHTKVASELTDLLAVADPLLQQINTTDLSQSISELDQATNGAGGEIATGIAEGAKLGTLLSTTLGAQLTALDSLSALNGALIPAAAQLNGVSQDANTALPAINRAQDNFQHLLESLNPLAENLAQFLSLYHPDIATLLTTGDNVTRVLVSHETNIQQTLKGLYEYVYKFANAPADTLPDGSRIGYFQVFIDFSQVNDLVCSLIAPASTGLAALAPLQAALGAAGSGFDCSAQTAAFNQLNPTGTTTTAATTSAASSTSQQGNNVAQQVYQAVGAPAAPAAPQSLSGYLSMLLGGL